MDGTLADRIANERRLRPATQSYALAAYPQMILKLWRGQLHVDTVNCPEHKPIVVLFSNDPHDYYAIVREDFDICHEIANAITIPLFLTDTDVDYLDRIRAMVQVRFSGRPQ